MEGELPHTHPSIHTHIPIQQLTPVQQQCMERDTPSQYTLSTCPLHMPSRHPFNTSLKTLTFILSIYLLNTISFIPSHPFPSTYRTYLFISLGENPHLQSNWDDGEGYYKPRIGEMIGERYQTLGTVGKGVFSIVIKCQDMRAKEGETDRGIFTYLQP